ncbi:hypothetical protein HMP09_2748 [Sphingomonas sp. HMP9]|nr:hypothetical protein HMP09_2748 [Sphingomonas sp. HMP9]
MNLDVFDRACADAVRIAGRRLEAVDLGLRKATPELDRRLANVCAHVKYRSWLHDRGQVGADISPPAGLLERSIAFPDVANQAFKLSHTFLSAVPVAANR